MMDETIIHIVALLICGLIAVLEITVAGREPFHWIAVICGIIGIALPAPYTFFDEKRKYTEINSRRTRGLSKYEDLPHSSGENYTPLRDITDAPPLKTIDPPINEIANKEAETSTDEIDSLANADAKPKPAVKNVITIAPSLGALFAVVILAAVDKSSGVTTIQAENQTLKIPEVIDYEISYSPFNDQECIRGVYNESEYILNNGTSMGLCFLNEELYYDYFVFIKQQNKNPLFFSQKTWSYILVDSPYMNRVKKGCRYVLIQHVLNEGLHFKHCVNETGNNHQATNTYFWNHYTNITLDSIAWNNFMGYLYDVALQGTRVNLLHDYCEHQLECTKLQNCPAMNVHYPLNPNVTEP